MSPHVKRLLEEAIELTRKKKEAEAAAAEKEKATPTQEDSHRD